MRWSHNQPHTVEGILRRARSHEMRINAGPMMDTGLYATLETCITLVRLTVGKINTWETKER